MDVTPSESVVLNDGIAGVRPIVIMLVTLEMVKEIEVFLGIPLHFFTSMMTGG
jgi:hypothetical protein